jgi:glycosyltransferase involved in cell wall biosynthesis
MTGPRLAIVSTHPIQYYAPIFQRLTQSTRLQTRVFFTFSQTKAGPIADQGFGRSIVWDLPLRDGYEHEFVPNIARKPGTDHFWGLRNPQLTRAIEAWGPTAVLVFGWNSASHLQALLHFKHRLPVFFRGDSTLLDRGTAWRRAARRVFLTWVYRHIDVAIAVGENNRDYFRWCGVPDDRIVFAPHAIDTQRFADPDGLDDLQAARWRTELRIPAGARVILFAGKLIPKKAPELLLEAFFRSKLPAHLVFVGSGALESELRRRAAGRDRVHFLPFQNQQLMPAVYRLGDLFVLPSRGPGETWGLALNEAMASGRPVIASSKVGGARDLVTAGSTGWVFDSGDVDALAATLTVACDHDRTRLADLGLLARRRSSLWSIESAAAGIEQAVTQFETTAPGAGTVTGT